MLIILYNHEDLLTFQFSFAKVRLGKVSSLVIQLVSMVQVKLQHLHLLETF